MIALALCERERQGAPSEAFHGWAVSVMTGRTRKTLMAGAVLLMLFLAGTGLAVFNGLRDGFSAPEQMLLWPAGAPGALGNDAVDAPSVAVFLPPRWRASGAGMIICPGGAYKLLMTSYEGADIAHWLNSFGVAGFVLSYRLAPRYHYPAPMLDVQRAGAARSSKRGSIRRPRRPDWRDWILRWRPSRIDRVDSLRRGQSACRRRRRSVQQPPGFRDSCLSDHYGTPAVDAPTFNGKPAGTNAGPGAVG